MQQPKSRKISFFIGLIFVLVLLCYSLPEALLFWYLCSKQDHNLPPNTEVIVSACRTPTVVGVPDGEVLFVREHRTNKMYLLDLRTGEKRELPNDPLLLDDGVFLSSKLVWLEGSLAGPGDSSYSPHYILDLTDGQRYELLDLTWFPRGDGGKLNPKYYAYFQSAEQIFIHHSKNYLIALSSDFRTNPDGRIILSGISIASEDGDLLEQLMKDLSVDYEIVDFSLHYADVLSPTGRYVVRGDGIYVSGTNTAVVNRDMGFYFKSWYYDESGVIVQYPAPYLINFPEVQGHYRIPSPILKLRLPAP